MGPLDLLDHLLNFVAPALVVGVLLAVAGQFLGRNNAGRPGWIAQAAINSIAGVAALTAALWFFGRDGKMAAYAALVLVCATAQWIAQRR